MTRAPTRRSLRLSASVFNYLLFDLLAAKYCVYCFAVFSTFRPTFLLQRNFRQMFALLMEPYAWP